MSRHQPDQATPKILYIESNSVLRTLMTQLLKSGSKYEIELARNGVEGVEKARAWPPDLILMGLRMPVMNGYEAIEAVRHEPATGNIPIIVISPWSTARSKARALAAGADEHLTPPVDLPRLLKSISRYLKQENK